MRKSCSNVNGLFIICHALIQANVFVLLRFTNYSIKESSVSDAWLCSTVKLHGVVINFSNHQSYNLVRYTCIESRLGLVVLILEFQSHVFPKSVAGTVRYMS